MIRLGDHITGRDVTMGNHITGTVTAIHYPAGLGRYTDTPNDQPDYRRRYTITAGSGTAIVECAETN